MEESSRDSQVLESLHYLAGLRANYQDEFYHGDGDSDELNSDDDDDDDDPSEVDSEDHDHEDDHHSDSLFLDGGLPIVNVGPDMDIDLIDGRHPLNEPQHFSSGEVIRDFLSTVELFRTTPAEPQASNKVCQAYLDHLVSINEVKEEDIIEYTECPICIEEFQLGETATRLPKCSHIFHDTCIKAWFLKHNTCPVCRDEIETDNGKYLRSLGKEKEAMEWEASQKEAQQRRAFDYMDHRMMDMVFQLDNLRGFSRRPRRASDQLPIREGSENRAGQPHEFFIDSGIEVYCDNCNRICTVNHYRCQTCESYDLCDACYPNAPNLHDATHTLTASRSIHEGRERPEVAYLSDLINSVELGMTRDNQNGEPDEAEADPANN